MEIRYIGVHHFAGTLSLAALNALHKSEWPEFPSELRPDLWVGYNFVIWADGSWLQARAIGEETAAQKGHNFDTVSISLYGNLSKTLPTAAQVETLRRFLYKLTTGLITSEWAVKPGTTVNIPASNIEPHRVLQPNHTECYGTRLSDGWARELLPTKTSVAPSVTKPASVPPPLPLPTQGPEWTRLRQSLQDLLELFRRKTGVSLGSAHYCIDDVRG